MRLMVTTGPLQSPRDSAERSRPLRQMHFQTSLGFLERPSGDGQYDNPAKNLPADAHISVIL